MKWSMDHVLTWCFMTEFVLTVDLYRLINSCWVYMEVRQQSQNCRLYTVVSDRYKVSGRPSGYKTCPTNRPRWTLTSVTLKNWSNKKTGIMSCRCILIRCTHDKNLELIQSLVQELCFRFWPLVAKTRIRSDRNLVCEFGMWTFTSVTLKSRSNQKLLCPVS
jgi:hypothetical protein